MTGQDAAAGLGAAMDARALNVQQTRTIYNPSPEVDSLVEEINSLARFGVPVDAIHRLIVHARQLLQSNVEEGECEKALAGLFDSHLRRRPGKLGVVLRDALGDMLGPPDGIAYFKACCVVRDVIRDVPAERLLTPTMRHELRSRRFDLLASLIESVTV